MKFATARQYAEPEKAARKLLEICTRCRNGPGSEQGVMMVAVPR
jgi:hypothetical protein